MFSTFHSNRMEALLEQLLAQLSAAPGNPMSPEVIVVQNPGMERWLSQQIAMKTGIAANLEFPLPASFVWKIFQSWIENIPDQSEFDRGVMVWKILALLKQNKQLPEFAVLSNYLQDDAEGLLHYQLAKKIADLFDQYLVFRPDMLLSWENNRLCQQGPDEIWQMTLWRDLLKSSEGRHRAALFAEFHQKIQSGQLPLVDLPERVSLFGLTALAPVNLQVIAALSQHIEVSLYLLNPCEQYWADITDEKGLARKRGIWRQSGHDNVSALMDVGNPLLASMGQAGQVFVDQLLELGADMQDGFVEPGNDTLLAQVQSDILELQDRRLSGQDDDRMPLAVDDSIQVHVCHSRFREVQVLHDHLLHFFNNRPSLKPSRVVVMMPDVNDYKPYIDAVFGAAEGLRHIPWSVADTGTGNSLILDGLMRLLKLPASRFEASWVMALLEIPALAARYGFSTTALERIRDWIGDTAIRWSFDAAMRQSLDLPGIAANSWESGLQRLFLGYAMPVDAEQEGLLRDGVLPYSNIETQNAEDLGALQALLERLHFWYGELARRMDVQAWVQRIQQLLGDFFVAVSDEDEQLLQQIHNVLAKLYQQAGMAGTDDAVPVTVMLQEIEQALTQQDSARHFLSGGVTFCNMVPMRSIPFDVVCLLGLNDGEFPRQTDSGSFDLMKLHPKAGDRSRRLDDRYLFLEALLSARQIFYISYVGYSIRDNSEKTASVVVSELLDYLASSSENADLQQWLTRHPLQAFSPRYFDRSQKKLFSYDQGWLAAADASGNQQQTAFLDTTLSATDDALNIELSDLKKFYHNPVEWFMKECLGVHPLTSQAVLDDEDPFDVGGLVGYRFGQQILEHLVDGGAIADIRPRILAQQQLPHAQAGELVFEEISAELEAMSARVIRHLTETPEKLEVDLVLGKFHLNGWLPVPGRGRGLLRYRAVKLKAKDQVALWIEHLLLCLLYRQQGLDLPESHYIAKDQSVVFSAVEEPELHLEAFLEYWLQGQTTALAFFPEVSLLYAHKQDLAKAKSKFDKDYDSGQNGLVMTAFRGQEPLGEVFVETALRLLEPMLEHRDLSKAGSDL